MGSKNVAIILPTKDNPNQLDHCLRTLLDSTSYENFRIIIVESNTSNHPLNPMYNWQKAMEHLYKNNPFKRIKIISTSSEGINIKAINIGIEDTQTEDILLIHDDMQFFKLYRRDWLRELATKDLSKIGMVTYQGNFKKSGKEYLENLPWVGSWFCYIPRETINEVSIYEEM